MNFHLSKIHKNAGNGLDFSKISRGSMTPHPLEWLHASGAHLLRLAWNITPYMLTPPPPL